MCLVAYIAASRSLTPVEWRPEAPAFHVAEGDAGAARVRPHMRLPFVYYIGSHEGCGCGFNRANANEEDPSQLAATRRTLAALRDYVQAAIAAAGPVELYTCWDGDETEPIDHDLTVGVDTLGPEMDWFPERSRIHIVP